MERPQGQQNVANLARFYELQERGHRYILEELEKLKV
jgi:hypothetical protein